MNDFSKRIETAAPADPPMPCFHTCFAKPFLNILRERLLKATLCDVFEEKLVYLFYGKPSYKPNAEKSTSFLAYMPVCIALDYSSVPSPHRVAPFDTGAFDLYAEVLGKRLLRDMFLMKPDLSMPRRLVTYFYRSNRNYFDGTPVYLEPGTFDFEIEAYYNLVNNKGLTSFDERRSTVEIQISSDIALGRDVVKLVIAPRRVIDEPEFQAVAVNEWNATCLPYSTQHWETPHYASAIFTVLDQYLSSKGLI